MLETELSASISLSQLISASPGAPGVTFESSSSGGVTVLELSGGAGGVTTLEFPLFGSSLSEGCLVFSLPLPCLLSLSLFVSESLSSLPKRLDQKPPFSLSLLSSFSLSSFSPETASLSSGLPEGSLSESVPGVTITLGLSIRPSTTFLISDGSEPPKTEKTDRSTITLAAAAVP